MTTCTSRSATLLIAGALALGLSACGGDADPDPGTSAADEASVPATPDAGESESGPEGVESESETVDAETVGTVTVDGVEYDIHTLRNCVPAEDGPFDTELELQGRGTVAAGQGYDGRDWVQIDVYVRSMSDMQMDQVSWAGPEGVFGTEEAPTIDLTDDAVSGSATALDSLTQTDSIAIEFALPVPDELIDCQL